MAMEALPTFEDADFWLDIKDVSIGPEIGRGQFSTVYVGKYFGDLVAIKKQIRKEVTLESYILRELAVLKVAQHENLVTYIGACNEVNHDADGLSASYIVTELCHGGDLLRLLLDQDIHLSWRLRFRICKQVCGAIHFLHRKNLIHRDIKSSNVLLDEHWNCKITDFGMARMLEWEGASSPRDRRRMTICGTEEYMAPEMLFDEEYALPVDIFSFGMVLFEVLKRAHVGKDGFLIRRPNTKFEIDMTEVRNCMPKDIPESLFTLAEQCVSYEPEQRPSSEEALDWLQDLLETYHGDNEDLDILEGGAVAPTIEAAAGELGTLASISDAMAGEMAGEMTVMQPGAGEATRSGGVTTAPRAETEAGKQGVVSTNTHSCATPNTSITHTTALKVSTSSSSSSSNGSSSVPVGSLTQDIISEDKASSSCRAPPPAPSSGTGGIGGNMGSKAGAGTGPGSGSASSGKVRPLLRQSISISKALLQMEGVGNTSARSSLVASASSTAAPAGTESEYLGSYSGGAHSAGGLYGMSPINSSSGSGIGISGGRAVAVAGTTGTTGAVVRPKPSHPYRSSDVDAAAVLLAQGAQGAQGVSEEDRLYAQYGLLEVDPTPGTHNMPHTADSGASAPYLELGQMNLHEIAALTEHKPAVLKEGYLYRRNESGFRTWKKLWCTLTETQLAWKSVHENKRAHFDLKDTTLKYERNRNFRFNLSQNIVSEPSKQQQQQYQRQQQHKQHLQSDAKAAAALEPGSSSNSSLHRLKRSNSASSQQSTNDHRIERSSSNRASPIQPYLSQSPPISGPAAAASPVALPPQVVLYQREFAAENATQLEEWLAAIQEAISDEKEEDWYESTPQHAGQKALTLTSQTEAGGSVVSVGSPGSMARMVSFMAQKSIFEFDSVTQWLQAIRLPPESVQEYAAAFEAKGYGDLGMIGNGGLQDADFEYLGVENPLHMRLMRSSLGTNYTPTVRLAITGWSRFDSFLVFRVVSRWQCNRSTIYLKLSHFKKLDKMVRRELGSSGSVDASKATSAASATTATDAGRGGGSSSSNGSAGASSSMQSLLETIPKLPFKAFSKYESGRLGVDVYRALRRKLETYLLTIADLLSDTPKLYLLLRFLELVASVQASSR